MNQDELDSGDLSNKFSDYFQFQSFLGKGAFGTVVAAINKNDKKEYAVKVFNKQSISATEWERLRQEVKILSDLNHPNIVRFKEIVETERRIFLAMELAKGGSLKDLIDARRNNGRKFTDEEVSMIMKSILSAVQYLHTKEIVHRDLKPDVDNILVLDWEDLRTVKIADFGLSVQFSEDGFMRTFKQKCGTMIYMAPEQASGEQYSRPVDIWSCGIIMYILLTGKHPLYERTDNPEIYLKKLRNPNWNLDEHFTSLAQNFFLKLMSQDPVVRYTAADTLKHPWITRRFDDQIPLSAHEVMACFSLEQSFSRILKALYLVNSFDPEHYEEKEPVNEDYRNLVEKSSHEHHAAQPHRKLSNCNLVQYGALESLLGIVSPKKSTGSPTLLPIGSPVQKIKEIPNTTQSMKNSQTSEENKSHGHDNQLHVLRGRTEENSSEIHERERNYSYKITQKSISSLDKLDVNHQKGFSLKVLTTSTQKEELADAHTTPDSDNCSQADNNTLHVPGDYKDVFMGMKNYMSASLSKDARDNKKNGMFNHSYQDHGSDNDSTLMGSAKNASLIVPARKRAPSLNNVTPIKPESVCSSPMSEDSSEESGDTQRLSTQKDDGQRMLKKSPFFHDAQRSSSNFHASKDKQFYKSPSNPSTSRQKTKDVTLPQIMTPNVKTAGTMKKKESEKIFSFKLPPEKLRTSLVLQTTLSNPSPKTNKIPVEPLDSKLALTRKVSGGLKKNFKSSQDLVNLINLNNVKDSSFSPHKPNKYEIRTENLFINE